MNETYKAGDFRQTIAAIACAFLVGSALLLGAVAPANAIPAPAAANIRIVA